jgi:DNA-binding XRE family transcriptional regulator
MDLKLFQRDVAGIIGVTECTINNWENGEIKPETKYIPRIIDFLGYTPFECPVDILMLKSRFAVDAFV